MQTKRCNSRTRQIWLAVAAAFGLATPAFCQSWEGTNGPSSFTPPTSAGADAEAKAAVAANRGEVKPAGFIRPSPRPLPVPPATTAPVLGARQQPPVWNVAPPGETAAVIPNNGERSIHEFGTGWKNFVNQKVFGAPPPPAATLTRPRAAPATPTARMDWNWQGYDTYNERGGEVVAGDAAAQKGMHADMAPYMKYAHLWRSSNNGFAKPVLSSADPAGLGPMPLSQNRVAPASNWNSGRARPETSFAANEPIKSPIRPTSFATIAAPTPAEALPQRPSQFPAPEKSRPQDVVNGVPRSVRESVAALCMDKARNITVELVSPMRLRIAFRVRQQSDAETLTEQLVRLRDLAPYKVDFEVQIGQ